MSIIPEKFMDAVVAIGINTPDNQKFWIGTGFVVRRKGKNNLPDTFYLITNKHVVEGKSEVHIHFNVVENGIIKDKDYVVILSEKENLFYTPHPNKLTDVVAIQISQQTLINDQSIWGFFDLDDHALTLSQMKETGVEEGNFVYALGFPMNLVDVIKSPVCRLGCIARIRDAFIKSNSNIEEFPTNEKELPKFFVDAQAFPGNSGGPIISRPETLAIHGTTTNPKANLIGILSGYIPYKDTLVSLQTKQPVMIREENSGLTVVHPVDRIKEVVELEFNRINNIVNFVKKNNSK